MRNSNPRGLAPNPLSKSASGRSSMFRPHREAGIRGMATDHEPSGHRNQPGTGRVERPSPSPRRGRCRRSGGELGSLPGAGRDQDDAVDSVDDEVLSRRNGSRPRSTRAFFSRPNRDVVDRGLGAPVGDQLDGPQDADAADLPQPGCRSAGARKPGPRWRSPSVRAFSTTPSCGIAVSVATTLTAARGCPE